jgi:plastocyanin
MMDTRISSSIGAAIMMLAMCFSAPSGAESAVAAAAIVQQQVRIDNFTFSPAEITVPAGAKVTFLNADDIPHVVAAVNKTFRSKALDTDDAYSFTFVTPGVYDYFCALHPHMQGRVIVK